MAEDWSRYNLPAIWTMLKDENVCDGADRVLGWDSLAQDVDEQHKRLLAARDKLAEVWSPDKNVSARVFLQRVTDLATSMSDTMTAAQDNRAGLQGVMDAIATAQSTLSPIVQSRKVASKDLIPRFVDGAEDDDDQAGQRAMRMAEAAIQDHSAQFRSPQLYQLASNSGSTTDLPGDDGGAPRSSTASGGSLAAVPKPVPVPHDPPDFGSDDKSDRPTPGDSSTGGAGPGLAGVLGATPPPSAILGVLPPVPGGTQSGGLPGLVIGGGALGFGAAAGIRSIAGGSGFGLGARAAGGRQTVPIRRGLPSGATIGAEEAEGGLGGRGATGQGSLLGQTGGRGRQGDAAPGEMIGGDPDLLWDVRQGVAPVIEPDLTPVRHDPGPGVIGFGA